MQGVENGGGTEELGRGMETSKSDNPCGLRKGGRWGRIARNSTKAKVSGSEKGFSSGWRSWEGNTASYKGLDSQKEEEVSDGS